MIGYLRAFAWLRFRLLLNSFRRRRRDSFEMLSAIAAIAVPAIILIFFLSGAVLVGVLSYMAGASIGSGRADPEAVLLASRLLLMLLLGVVVVFPIGRGAHASLAAHPRLMLLPIPRRLLHGLEVATTAADPWILLVVPGLLLLPAGILGSGRITAGCLIFLAGLGYLASIVSIAALVSYTVQFLLRDRRRGELATLIGAIALILLSLAPAYLSGKAPDDEIRTVRRLLEGQAWLGVLPSELYVRTAAGALEGRSSAGLLPLTALLAEAALIFFLSGHLFNRLIGSVETGRARGKATVFPRFPDIPLVAPGTAAVAVIMVRGALRTIKGKLSVFTPGPLTFLFGMLLPTLPMLKPFAHHMEGQGHLLLALAGMMCLLSLHPIMLNQFAIDGAGRSLLFVSPLDDRSLLRGKAIGGAALFAIALLPCVAASAILLPGGSPLLYLSTLLGLIAAYALTAAPAAILSAFLPKASNLNTLGSAGNAHPLATVIGFFMTVIAVLPGSGITGVLAGRPFLAIALSGIWSALALAIAVPLMNLAAIFLAERRESLGQTSG